MVGKRSSFRGRASDGRSVKRRDRGHADVKNKNRLIQPIDQNEQSKRSHEILRPKTEESNVKETTSVVEDDLTFQNDRNAYNELLFSLQGKGGSFTDAYARRQREEQGASSSDEDEEEDEELEELDVGPTHSGEKSEDEEIDEVQEDGAALKVKGGVDHDNGDDDSEEGGEEVTGEHEEDEVEEEEEEEDEDDEGHVSASSSDGEVGDDTVGNRVASHGQAGIGSDPFRCHLEHQFNVSKETNLLQSLQKFSGKIPAGGTPGMSWVFSQSSNIPKAESSLAAYAVKKRLQDSWRKVYGKSSHGDFKSELQRQFYSFCATYKDILHTNRLVGTGSGRNSEEDLTLMDAYVAHILNHLMKTRDLITKDNEKVRLPSAEPSDPPRDQGYTRPKVLVLLPFRSSALTFVTCLLKLMPHPQNANVENKGRFFDDFGVAKGDVETDSRTQSTKEKRSAKPADFIALFSGNNDDHFRIGIKFTRKSVKLYTEFYSSDIIIASPLGLITKIGEADGKRDKDVDFLSSIEMVVLDYTDVTLMQNWSHVMSVFDYLNQLPVHQHGTDFMRIREWYLNGHARHYRQTIIISSFPDAGVNALFRSCINHAGKVKAQCEYEGLLSKIVLQVRQVFEKVECTQISDLDDARFEFFVKQIFPQIKNSLQGGTMIFIRTYFEYVRLRNLFKAESSSVCLLGEYTSRSNISRARSSFFHGNRKIILYTQRAHFFYRFKIRGIKDLIFYSLPDQAHFYVEMLNMLEGNENPSCTVLFSRFDSLQASYIVNVKEDAIRPMLLWN